MGLIPEVFDLGDDDVLTVLAPEPSPADEPLVIDAVRQCPRQAISFVD
jgi:ferredoxin